MLTMNKQQGYIRKIGILFFMGLFIGGIAAFLMKNYYQESYYTYFETASAKLTEGSIHYGFLFFKTMQKLIMPYLLMIALSMSPVYPAFVVAYTVYFGFSVGYFMESLFATYQVRGILYGILYGMPQMLIYIPAMLLLMYLGWQISQNGQKKKGLLEKLLPLGMVLFLLLAGAALETFVNSFIMQKTVFLVAG